MFEIDIVALGIKQSSQETAHSYQSWISSFDTDQDTLKQRTTRDSNLAESIF